MVSETVSSGGMYFGPIMSVSPGASPFTWQNPENVRVQMFVSLGTVTTIEFSPDNVTYINCGLVAGTLILNPRQYLRITYVVAPTLNYIPI